MKIYSNLHFEVVWSVVLRENTSIKRRTISLQPPFDGQHIKIFIRFFGVTDEETVGDWSLQVDVDNVDLNKKLKYEILNEINTYL